MSLARFQTLDDLVNHDFLLFVRLSTILRWHLFLNYGLKNLHIEIVSIHYEEEVGNSKLVSRNAGLGEESS